MTIGEYKSRKAKTNKETAKQVQDKLRKVRVMYLKATKRINRVVSRLPGGTLSASNRDKIVNATDRLDLYKEITGYIDDGRKAVIKSAFDVDREYVEDAFKDAGKTVDLSAMFDRQAERIDKNYRTVNSTMEWLSPAIVKNRAVYSLSSSVWDAIDGFSDKILAIIQAELDAGTDPVRITRILEEYLASGAEKVLGRWNDLKIGTPEYRKRLGTKGADYRTQRVVRTEMYSARRDADIQSGRMNPGATGMFTWNLSPFHNHCDKCADRASGGEYTAEQIQAMNDSTHSNCGCYCQPVLQDRDTFVQSLRDYVRGDETPGAAEIDAWASKYGFTE
jgi:hypothetical protein